MTPDSRELFVHLHDEELRSRLVDIRRAAREILEIDLMLHFTDHTMAHSDRVAALANEFVAPIQGGETALNDRELFILYAASYLHDIGMHNERLGDSAAVAEALTKMSGVTGSTRAPGRLGWDELQRATQLELLRTLHHLISAEMILSSIDAETPPIGVQLRHEEGPEYIAWVCEAHGLDRDAEDGERRYTEITQDRGRIRVGLLAALLRIADILDESQRRANPTKRRALALDLEARCHWFRHHYTEDITFDRTERAIIIWFDFSEENYRLYGPVIPALQVPHIQAELNRHMPLLHRYLLGWTLISRDTPKPVTTTDPIPDDVLEAMRRQVDAKGGLAMQDTISAADLFAEKYEGIKERLAELRSQKDCLPPPLYLRELGRMAAELHDAGGSRSAWNLLYRPFEQGKASLDPREQLRLGCLLATTMAEDQPHWACHVLVSLTPVADGLAADNPDKGTYWRLRARCMFNAYCDDFVDAVTRALELTTCANARQELWSNLCEWYLLQGRLGEAMEAVGAVEQAAGELPVAALLVASRVGALTGNAEGTEEALRAALNSAEAAPVVTRLAMLRAEVLHLSFRDEEATEVLRQHVAPALGDIAHASALAAADNQALVSLHLPEADTWQEFYAQIDVRRLSGTQLWDASEVITGQEAAERGEHHRALPIFWRLLVSTYRPGCWRPYRWASRVMARECIELAGMRPDPHWVPQALFHALNSGDQKLVDMAGERLMAWGDAARVGRAVASCLRYAGLPHHAGLAAHLIARISDAIPDGLIDAIADWLLGRSPASLDGWAAGGAFSSIWEAVASLGPRLSPGTAEKLVSAAVGHVEWRRRSAFRTKLIDAVTQCLPALAPEYLSELVAHAVPLAADADVRSDRDYADAVNLLYQLAQLVDQQTKDGIASALYGGDAGPVNAILVQIAPFFGVKLREDDGVREWAHDIAAQIRLQVQRTAPGQPPAEAKGSLGTVAQQTEEGTVHVALLSHSQGLRALIQYRHTLGHDEMQDLVSAILDLAAEPQNVLANRESLLYDLGGLADCLSDALAVTAFGRLRDIAAEDVLVEGVALTDERNPLNPFKMDMGTADEVRGMALFTLSRVASARPSEERIDQMNELLASALTSSSEQVRRMATEAARTLPRLTPLVFYDLLLTTRDHNPSVAASAIYAFAGRGGLQLDDGQTHSLAYSVLMAAKSSDRGLRRAAAYVLAQSDGPLSSGAGSGNPNVEEARKILASDVCFSVRSVFAASGAGTQTPYAPAGGS